MEYSTSITLADILQEVQKTFDGEQLHWAILSLDGMPNSGQGKFTTYFKKLIEDSGGCLSINWKDLEIISDSFFQIYETIILGSKDKSVLHNYANDEEMYEACDISIELIDCSSWEIFSRDQNLIHKLIEKYKSAKLLQSDFQNYINQSDEMQRPTLTDVEVWKNLDDNKTRSLYDYIPYALKTTSPDVLLVACELFWPTFTVYDSQVFLSENFSEESFKRLSKENESIEYRMNFLAIDPYFMYEDDRFKRAEFMGRSLVEAWREKLKHDFPKLEFIVEYRLDTETRSYGVSFYQKIK